MEFNDIDQAALTESPTTETAVPEEQPSSYGTDDTELTNLYNSIAEGKPLETEEPTEAASNETEQAIEETEEPVVEAIPLPATMSGHEELWNKIPEDVRQELFEQQSKLNETINQQSQLLDAYNPIGNVLVEFKEYFDGTYKDAQGSSVTPQDGIKYLLNVQRAFDRDPVGTLVNLVEHHGLGSSILERLGQQTNTTSTSDVSQEKNTVDAYNLLARQLQDIKRDIPQKQTVEGLVEARLTEFFEKQESDKRAQEEFETLAKDKPLLDQISTDDLVFFIQKAWGKLGPAADKSSVFSAAYSMAISADPALRTAAQAALETRKADAKKINSVNITSASKAEKIVGTSDEDLMNLYTRLAQG